MLENIDKKVIFRNILIYGGIGVLSFSLTRISFFYNYFIFIVPFIIFCFMNNKWFGYFSYIVSFFALGSYNKLFYLSYLVVLIAMLFFKNIIRTDNKKLKSVISFYCFGLVLIEGIISNFIYKYNDYFSVFLCALVSYWIMRYFYDLYINTKLNEKRYLSPFLGVFVVVIIGISLLGLNARIGVVNFSLILIVLLSFIAGKVSLETGVLYSFLMLVMFNFSNNISINFYLFFSSCLISFLLSKTSKLTLLFTYFLGVFSFLYYFDLEYVISVNYCLGALLFIFIPNNFINYFSSMCLGSEKYIEKLVKDNKKLNLEITNKILKMEEVFSLVSSKLNVRGRLKKCEKELLVEEVSVFDSLLRKFAEDIKENYAFNYYDKVEKEIYKYGFDLLYFEVKEDVFKDLIVDMNIRCDRKDIEKFIVPVVSKVMKKHFKIVKVISNEVLGYYEIKLRIDDEFKFNFGVGQRAKDGKICGDSYLVYENERKKVFALSDGMGVGKEAKEKSKMALDLFKKFMDIGFEEKQTINSINCILKSEYSKDSYATLDLFVYDKYMKDFSFYKNGACDSFVFDGKSVERIEGDELPIGIMDKIEVKEYKISVSKGDYVVITSDGISEERIINNLKGKDSQMIVKSILKDDKEISDDQSVIVVKIK